MNKTIHAKKRVIEALTKSLGVVSVACKKAGVSRGQYYNWCKDDPEFKSEVDDIQDIVIDFAESMLFKRIKEGSDAAIFFYLKTKGKKRGYIERDKEEDAKITVEVVRSKRSADPD